MLDITTTSNCETTRVRKTYILAVSWGILYSMRKRKGQPTAQIISFARHLDSTAGYQHTIWERDIQLEQTTLPHCLCFTRNTAFPALQIQHALGGSMRSGVETERMIPSPLLPMSSLGLQISLSVLRQENHETCDLAPLVGALRFICWRSRHTSPP